MRRPAHGATSRPGPCRPASGYGRADGRPGPHVVASVVVEVVEVVEVVVPDVARAVDPAWFSEPRAGVEPPAGVEVPAPVTP
jgi:hypothetical protein